MSKIIKFGPPSRFLPIDDLDKELQKFGIPEHARTDAVEVARAFDKSFKIPAANFQFQLPDGITDEQAAIIELRALAALSLYHDAWRLALFNFSGTLQDAVIRQAMGLMPRET